MIDAGCLSSRARFCRHKIFVIFVWNVLAPVLISCDVPGMSQLPCSYGQQTNVIIIVSIIIIMMIIIRITIIYFTIIMIIIAIIV